MQVAPLVKEASLGELGKAYRGVTEVNASATKCSLPNSGHTAVFSGGDQSGQVPGQGLWFMLQSTLHGKQDEEHKSTPTG